MKLSINDLRNRGLLFLGSVILLVTVSGCYDELDRCLDDGGGWDDSAEECFCTRAELENFAGGTEEEKAEACIASRQDALDS